MVGKYNSYGDYKESGIDWLGQVPKHWSVKSLKSILAERKEKNCPIITKEILSLTMDRGVIPYSERGGGGNKAKEDLTAYKLAYPNDIVLNSMNVVVGSVGLSKYFGAVSPVYYMLYPRKEQDKVEYFNHIFQSKTFQKSLLGLGNGILMKESESSNKLNTIRMRIPMGKLNTQHLPYPSEQEQEKIANFLDYEIVKIDTLINKQQQLIKLLKEKRQMMISHAVTKGLNPTTPMRESGITWLGDVPEHWDVKRLRYLGRCQNGINIGAEYFGTGFPFLSYGDAYKNEVLPKIVSGLVQSTELDRERYSVLAGDVIFTRTSETVEEIGLSSTCLSTIENASFAGFLIRFRPKDKVLDAGFSKYYFRNVLMRIFFIKEMNLVTRASLSQDLLKKLPVTLPPLDEQREIAEFLDGKSSIFSGLISSAETAIELMNERRTALISAAVTGKIDVRNWLPPEKTQNSKEDTA